MSPSLTLGDSKLRCYFLYYVFPDHVPKSGEPIRLIPQQSVHLLSTRNCVFPESRDKVVSAIMSPVPSTAHSRAQ